MFETSGTFGGSSFLLFQKIEVMEEKLEYLSLNLLKILIALHICAVANEEARRHVHMYILMKGEKGTRFIHPTRIWVEAVSSL
ncbi:hypothetical protein Hdeb2414_s0093g00789801 [Helianthus debilis subsp. tardiflorus]